MKEGVQAKTGLVVLTDDEQNWHIQLLELWFECIDRGTLRLHTPRAERDTVRAVGHQAAADEPLLFRSPRCEAGEGWMRKGPIGVRMTHMSAVDRAGDSAPFVAP